MKAVVVELREHDAAVLTNDGCIIRIKNRNYAIGQVVELKTSAAWKTKKIAVLAASAAAVVMLFGVTAWAYFTPYSYVSLDVNPSIEYSINRFDRVLNATAVNDDGSEILANLDLNNMPIEEAIKDTVDQIAQDGYFEGQDPGGIMISTSSENQQESEQLAQDLQTSAQEVTADNQSPVEVEAISIGLARVTEARALGTTPGKLNLVEKLKASMENSDSINVEEWLHKSVKEIMKAIKENKHQIKDVNKQNKHKEQSTSSTDESSVISNVESESTSSTGEKAVTRNIKSEPTSRVNPNISSKSENSSVPNETKKHSDNRAEESQLETTEGQDVSDGESKQSKVTGKPETNNTNQNNQNKQKNDSKGKSISKH